MPAELPPLDSLLGPVREIARQASACILKIYETDFSVETKADNSPLTAADLASHNAICDGLKKLTPNIPILSEESVEIPYATRSKWQRYWLIDPLDGTKEFVKKNGEFTVNIALIDGEKVILGVVDVPATDTAYFAAVGVGAFKAKHGSEPVKLSTRKLDLNNIVITGSRSHGGGPLAQFTESLPGNVELVAKGSSLKLCMVAEGASDIYPRLGLTSEWDTAASQCVVEQAGGVVVKLSFEPLVYNQKEDILNPFFLVIGDTSYDWAQHLPADLKH